MTSRTKTKIVLLVGWMIMFGISYFMLPVGDETQKLLGSAGGATIAIVIITIGSLINTGDILPSDDDI